MRPTIALLVGITALTATAAYAQAPTGQIQGTVRGETGVPLEGVSVVAVGTHFGAVTRPDGRYVIMRVAPGTYQLRATRIGYTSREQPITVVGGEEASADFTLPSAAIALDQVVVVGYGSELRKDLTGSVGSVSSQDIAKIPVARIDQAISGLVSGVQIQTTNAAPGSDSIRVRVRGSNSLQASNEPLVVVDGVIGADLNEINPGDIESVDVLKDASSTAIYGTRGANGVILVTTKRGRPGQIAFDYSGYTGVQDVSKHIALLSGPEFAQLYMLNPNHDKSVTFAHPESLATTDWQDVIYQMAPVRSHDVRISGTAGATSVMLSANWFDQDGVVLGSDFGRGSLRVNLDQGLGERVRVGTRVSYSRSVGNQVRVNTGYGSAGGPVTMMALRFAPTIPVYDTSGKFSGPLLAGQVMDNPLAIVDLRKDKSTTDYFIGNAFAEYDLVPGLTLRSSLAYTSRSSLEQQYTSRLLQASLNLGQANLDNTKGSTWLSENTITLRRTLAGKHDITLLGGFTAQETRSVSNGEQGIGFTSDELGYARINAADRVTGTSTLSRSRLASFLGRLNYGLAGKYLVTGTIRTDGSSKFAVNNRWAVFPSAAVAWRVSDEPFFRRLAPTLSELKLRLSAGRTGSEAIRAYQSLAAWSVGAPYAIGLTPFNNGATLDRITNPNLRWETTTEYDAGLDLGLLENRISVTVDAYHKTTSDLLYAKQVPYFTGFDSYLANIGRVQNRGLELAIDTRHTVGPLQLRLGGNLSLNRSKVLDLGADREFFLAGANSSLPNIRDGAIVRVGEPLGNFYGYVWDGIFQDSVEAAHSGQPGARPGGEKFRDLNGDGVVNSDDRTILGNAQPKYLFGLTGVIGYKSLSLSYIVRGALDFQVVNLNRLGMETPGGSTNMLRSVLDYWTPTNHTNAMTGLGIGPDNARMSSRWIEDGSFVRLQNVTVDWAVPPELTRRVGARQVRLYVSGQNLFTATRYSWYDPEVSSRGTGDRDLGWDDSSYPGTRTVTFGMNVGF